MTVLRLVYEISIPEVRRHRLRSGLTVVGIMLGVATFAAIRSANSALAARLHDTIDQVAGRAVLEIRSPSGVPESVLDDVRTVQGVRAAVPVIEAVVRTADARHGNILLLGIDMLGDQWMRDYTIEGTDEAVSDPLLFLARRDSILVSKEFATRHGLSENSGIELITGVGPKVFTVRGIMAQGGIAQAFGGNVAVLDIFSAQLILGRGTTFDRIDILPDDGVSLDQAASQIRAKIGHGFSVEPPQRRGRQMEALMNSYTRLLYVSGIVAVAVGVFLIFNTMTVSVAERRAQIGILRALGATRGQLARLFLSESLFLGLIGSVTGALAGLIAGRAMVQLMADIVAQTYGVHILVESVRFDAISIGSSVALGAAAAVVAAWIPAREAARVDPAIALQKGKYQVPSKSESRFRLSAGLLLLLVSLIPGVSEVADSIQLQSAIFAGIFAALALLAPTFSHVAARFLRYPMERLFGVEGRLATDSLVQAPRRTSATVAALMFSVAFVLMMASFSASVKTSFTRWIDATLNPDLFVFASNSITIRTFQFPASVADELKSIPGVRQVDSARVVNVEYRGSTPQMMSIEIEQWLRRSAPIMEDGNADDLLPRMAGSNGLLVSHNFARFHNLSAGSRIALDTPTGRHQFQVAGVQVDYTSDVGLLIVDRDTYKRLWNDDRVDTFDVMLRDGCNPAEVRTAIQKKLAGSRNAFVLTNQEMRGEIMRLTDQFLGLQYAQIVVAVVVALLGILNSLTVSITERKREIGLLRTLGGERWQVRRAVVLEAVCIGVVSVVLGIASGAVLGYYAVTTFGAAFNGWIFPYRFPLAAALAAWPAVVIVSLIGAWYPSTLAVNMPVVDALACE